MKRTLSLTLAALFLVAQGSPVFAATASQTFTVSATVPASSGVSITVSKVTSPGGVWSSVSGTSLSFDPLSLNTQYSVYLPGHYFAIDVAGAGALNVTVNYSDVNNPNVGTGNGLGFKSSIDFKKTTLSGGVTTDTAIGRLPKKLLKDVTATSVFASELTGGWLRMYLGINTGDSATPTGGEVFSPADKAGAYSGSLLVTATTS